jgi:hypothetical protein
MYPLIPYVFFREYVKNPLPSWLAGLGDSTINGMPMAEDFGEDSPCATVFVYIAEGGQETECYRLLHFPAVWGRDA